MIIIFGAAVRADGSPSGALRRRVQAALDHAGRLEEAVFMPTGGQGAHGPPEAEVMARLLQEAGVPAERITLEPTAANTIGSVRACAPLLRGQTGRVYVATNAYHLPRCLALLWLAGVRAWPCRPPPGSASRNRVKRWWWRLRELPAIPVDSVLLLWLRLWRRI